MIQGVLSSLVATVIAALMVYLWKAGYLQEWHDLSSEWLRVNRTQEASPLRVIPRLRRRLVRQLILDQSRSGVHYGQFGRSTSFAESAKYQRNPEDLSTKPRMYLTFWPGVVLGTRGLASRAVRLANRGVQLLFDHGCIHVHQPISTGSLPQRQTRLVSYRHTICGAYYLYLQIGWNDTTRVVLDRMLDPRNRWQNSDGGWAHSNKGVVDSDLWACAYAFRLLDAAITQCGEQITTRQSDLAKVAQANTVRFLTESWRKNKWAYGAAGAEENAVSLYIEVAEALPRYDRDLFAAVSSELETWLSPAGDLSEAYIGACHDVLPVQLRARMAYALFRGFPRRLAWSPLFEHVLHDDHRGLISSEVAFVIDLTFEYERSAKQLRSRPAFQAADGQH
jgi:hypothetical protein